MREVITYKHFDIQNQTKFELATERLYLTSFRFVFFLLNSNVEIRKKFN